MRISAALFSSLGQAMAGIVKTFSGFAVCQGFLFGIGLGLVISVSHPSCVMIADR
jgi:hypothetical protein